MDMYAYTHHLPEVVPKIDKNREIFTGAERKGKCGSGLAFAKYEEWKNLLLSLAIQYSSS